MQKREREEESEEETKAERNKEGLIDWSKEKEYI